MLYPMTPKVVELKLWFESLWTNTMCRRVRTRVVTDVQDPVMPILEAALAGDGLHDTRCMIARLREVVH